jgi:predicted O-methyltransferase YrrM
VSEPFDRWYEGKSFTTDWTTTNLENWTKFISPAAVRTVLEIGSWEGRSAIFFLEYCRNCRITCIDPFFDPGWKTGSGEANFDANLAGYGDRVEKIKSRSVPALDQLGVERRLFDVVYIDGSHARNDVIMDSILAWRLLDRDGLMIWDDYNMDPQLPDEDRPQQGIDLFLFLCADELEIVHMEYQVIVRKRSPEVRIPRTLKNFYRLMLGRPFAWHNLRKST